MIVTVDINVLLDVFQTREPHYADSARVVSMVMAGAIHGVCPAHGLTTLYYLVRKHASKADAEAALDLVLAHFHLSNLSTKDWQEARKMPIADFEDAVVAIVAKTTSSAFIITRNVADFNGSHVSAITPSDFLSRVTILS